ncbi:MAG TPA: zf-HC2 domain-containing protein [Anaerolineales bacterium]|nr:zf-HC2 domain-containing protein [Anaerolineales bacterium]
MNHFSDSQLNEYFDKALDPAARSALESHLGACSDCRARLEELAQLDSDLALLPEIELAHDLTSSVLARLPRSSAALRTRSLAAQFGAALGMILFIAFEIGQSIPIPSLSAFQIPIDELRFPLPPFEVPLPAFRFPVPGFWSPMLHPALSLPALPAIGIPFSSSQTSLIAVLTFLMGFIGNAILLHERSEAPK